MNSGKQKWVIPGTTIFDGDQVRKGYVLNKMSFPFNSAENRAELLRDKEAYCSKYGLNTQQRAVVLNLNVLDMLAAVGNTYYLAKLGGIFGLDMQDTGALFQIRSGHRSRHRILRQRRAARCSMKWPRCMPTITSRFPTQLPAC